MIQRSVKKQEMLGRKYETDIIYWHLPQTTMVQYWLQKHAQITGSKTFSDKILIVLLGQSQNRMWQKIIPVEICLLNTFCVQFVKDVDRMKVFARLQWKPI